MNRMIKISTTKMDTLSKLLAYKAVISLIRSSLIAGRLKIQRMRRNRNKIGRKEKMI